MNWDSVEIRKIIAAALKEDIGKGDVTSNTLVPASKKASAVFLAKEAGVIAGLPLVSRIFRRLDRSCKVRELVHDGAPVAAGTKICTLSGKARALLAGERLALNFLQRLSGIATQTAAYAKLAAPHGINVLDTRKTTPLLRSLEKYAVLMGGGTNHRIGLFDAVLVKDNHLQLQPDFRKILDAFPRREVEIEVTSPEMLETAISAGARWILLDNMTPGQIRECVRMKKKGMKFEVSGGINVQSFANYLIDGVDAISIGGLTHSVKSLDISMEIEISASLR